MTTRIADRIVLALFVLAGIGYLHQSYAISAKNPDGGFGPIQFPVILGLVLIVLCVAEFMLSLRRAVAEDESPLRVHNAGKLVLTVLLTAVFFSVWWYLRHFYATAGVFFFVLVMLYQSNRTLRSSAIAAITTVIFTAALYVLFGLAFGVRLS